MDPLPLAYVRKILHNADMEIEKIEKPDGRLKNGGARKNAGRKASVEKIADAARKLTWNEYVVGLAEASWPRLKALSMSTSTNVSLDALKLILGYAYGKPKETHDINVKDPIKIEIIRYQSDSTTHSANDSPPIPAPIRGTDRPEATI